MPAPAVPPGSRASIRDVARLAGVSAQTVSRVANGHPSVSPVTRERVQEAMAALGYVPNRTARALRSGCSRTIGVVAHRIDRTGEALTIQAIVAAAEAEGYSVTLTSVEPEAVHDIVRRMARRSVDALVVLRNEADMAEALGPWGIPVAVSGVELSGLLPAAVSDQTMGARLAVEHLLDLGHSTVHHIGGPADSEPGNLRAEVWLEVLDERGAPKPPIRRGDWTAASGHQLALELLGGDHPVDTPSGHGKNVLPTAIFCANDEMAFGVIRAAREVGIDIPRDLSVVGFDDISLAAYSGAPLTTVRQDFAGLGRELVRLVLDELNGHRLEQVPRVILPTELVVRSTTAAPLRS